MGTTIDCISRAQTQTEIEMNASRYTIAKERGGMGQVEWSDQLIKVSDAVDIIRHLSSVTPQERTGHWVGIDEEPHEDYECDKCGYIISTYTANIEPHTEYKYCPSCGARMIEPKESEEQA